MTPRSRSVSRLEDHLGYWLRYVSNQVSHAFSLELEGRGVTVAEWVVLRDLYDRGTVAPSDLADRLGMTRGAISKLIARLTAKALVARGPGAGDRRFQSVTLTPAGRALVPELATLADHNDSAFFGHLDAGERAVILGVMKDIVRRHGLRRVPVD